jgi:hypothetical protein
MPGFRTLARLLLGLSLARPCRAQGSSDMTKTIALAVALAALTASADARIINYTWHQTSTTWPGLDFQASFGIFQNAGRPIANSSQMPPHLGAVAYLYFQGAAYPAITLADLVPACPGPGLCSIGGALHDPGSPDWQINLPYLFYHATTEIAPPTYVFEWEYWTTSPTSIVIGDDNAGKRCWDTSLCTSYGYWTVDYAPEPATLFAFAAGLALLPVIAARRHRRAVKA